jgi:hypothetical protein
MNYLKLFELEILFRGLTQVFILTNKNRRRTELNENKINYYIGEKEESVLKTIFFQLCLQSVFSFLYLLFLYYSTPQFIVFGVINAPTILYNQSNLSYHSYTVALIV